MSAEKEKHPAWELLYAIQKDHSALGAKIQALRMVIASLDLPEPLEVACPKCGLKTRGPRSLAEHDYVSHDGPLPDHEERLASLIG